MAPFPPRWHYSHNTRLVPLVPNVVQNLSGNTKKLNKKLVNFAHLQETAERLHKHNRWMHQGFSMLVHGPCAMWPSRCDQVTGCKLLNLQSVWTHIECEHQNVFLDIHWLFVLIDVLTSPPHQGNTHRAAQKVRIRMLWSLSVDSYECVSLACNLNTSWTHVCVFLHGLVVSNIRNVAWFLFPVGLGCFCTCTWVTLDLVYH